MQHYDFTDIDSAASAFADLTELLGQVWERANEHLRDAREADWNDAYIEKIALIVRDLGSVESDAADLATILAEEAADEEA